MEELGRSGGRAEGGERPGSSLPTPRSTRGRTAEHLEARGSARHQVRAGRSWKEAKGHTQAALPHANWVRPRPALSCGPRRGQLDTTVISPVPSVSQGQCGLLRSACLPWEVDCRGIWKGKGPRCTVSRGQPGHSLRRSSQREEREASGPRVGTDFLSFNFFFSF